MKKVVLKLELLDEKVKQKAMKNVSSLTGVDSIAMDMKDKKLTVTGDIDPVTVVSKLRKICHTEIVSVGPAKEPEKKKDSGSGAANGDKKKDDKKKEDDKKKDDGKKKEDESWKLPYPVYNHHPQPYPYYNYNYQQLLQQQQGYYNQYNHPPTPYYSKVVHDENPPNCVIS